MRCGQQRNQSKRSGHSFPLCDMRMDAGALTIYGLTQRSRGLWPSHGDSLWPPDIGGPVCDFLDAAPTRLPSKPIDDGQAGSILSFLHRVAVMDPVELYSLKSISVPYFIPPYSWAVSSCQCFKLA